MDKTSKSSVRSKRQEGSVKPLSWEKFRYLNGVRRNNFQMLLQYEEYLQGLLDLGIIAVNGKVENQIKKLCLDISALGVTLSSQVEKERAKDLTLYLEDI